MSDVRETPAVLEAAERAASSGDLAAAEVLLHEVVVLQEATVGPGHADLASTYNNLAVVCEMAGRPTDAEQFYRRAYAIASAALDPQDPLVTTSFNNLKEFCQARGVPLELAAKMPAEPVAPAVLTRAERAPASPTAAPSAPVAVPARRKAAPAAVSLPDAVRPAVTSGTVIAGVLAAAAVVAVLAVTWPSRETPAPEADMPPPAPPVAAAPNAPSEAPPAAAATMPAPRETGGGVPAGPASAPPGSRPTNTRVLDARLCQSLSTQRAEWRCEAPSNPASPGRLSFYTRVAAFADVRVRHRWYHGDYLVQDVGLLVRANPSAGYRTYSRQTVNASGGGEWRVEVRTPDGALLREERFVVR